MALRGRSAPTRNLAYDFDGVRFKKAYAIRYYSGDKYVQSIRSYPVDWEKDGTAVYDRYPRLSLIRKVANRLKQRFGSFLFHSPSIPRLTYFVSEVYNCPKLRSRS